MGTITQDTLQEAIGNGLSVEPSDSGKQATICACESVICQFDFETQCIETDLHIKWDLYDFGTDWIPTHSDLKHGIAFLNHKLRGYWEFVGFEVDDVVRLDVYDSNEEPGDGRPMGVVSARYYPDSLDAAAYAIRFILYNDSEVWMRKRDYDVTDPRMSLVVM